MATETPLPQMLFWPGSLGSRGYEAVVEAACAGGFSHLAISPLMISQLLGSGRRAEEIVAEASASGVTLSHLDGVSSWAPIWYQDNPQPHIRARLDFSAEECLDFAQGFGLQSILFVGAFDRGALPHDSLVESFGRFCDCAARRKLRVELEFVPFWGIPDLPAAWDIVRQANRVNGGLLVDTWHLQKGSPDFERDLALLASLPPGQIRNVQLADARIQRQADSLYVEGRFRLLPGDGELALDRIIQTIARRNDLQWLGPEIFGAAIDGLSNTEAGKRSAACLRPFIDRMAHAQP